MGSKLEVTTDMVESYEVRSHKENGKLHKDFLPFNTYDLISYGYPVADKYKMMTMYHGGIDKNDILLPSKGKYCLVEDAMKIINELKAASS